MSAIGDCILTLPVACAIRDHWPNAHLAWVIESGAAPLLAGHPCIDELIVLPRGWLKSIDRIQRLRKQLQALKIDVSIDPQSIFKSAFACRLSGAPHRIGFDGEYGRELSRWMNNYRLQNRQPHIVDRSLELLEPLGIYSPEVHFRLPVDLQQQLTMKDFLDRVVKHTTFAVLNPGAGWKSKRWPHERYADIARHLGKQHAMPSVIVWADSHEQSWSDEIVKASTGHAFLAPPTNLRQLAELSRMARLFVGSDTGPLHLAAALDTPCVGMYGTTRPKDCGPYGPYCIALQQRYDSGRRRERRRLNNDAMKLITVDHVCKVCDQLLDRTSQLYTRNEVA